MPNGKRPPEAGDEAVILPKGCDVLKRSLNDPAILLLYVPLSNGLRRQAIAVVAGIVTPSCEAAAALLIIAFAGIVGMRAISYAALALLCAWMFVAWRHQIPKMTDAAVSGRDLVRRWHRIRRTRPRGGHSIRRLSGYHPDSCQDTP